MAPPPTTPHLIPRSTLPAALPVTELRTLATLLPAPPTTLEAAETTEAPEAVTPEATLEALAEAPDTALEAEAEAPEVVMAIELDREDRALASRDPEAEGALMVLERDPETVWPAQVCCWS